MWFAGLLQRLQFAGYMQISRKGIEQLRSVSVISVFFSYENNQQLGL